MAAPRKLTDRKALRRNRARVAARLETFLLDDVATEMHERLSEVNKSFTDVAIVTGFPEFWSPHFPGAACIEDAETLALEPESRDLILHMMSLHWADDPVGQLIQCRRALRPDGLLIATLFGGQTLHELRAALAEAEAALTGGLSPRIAPMGEIRDLGALLQRAGFALPVADNLMRQATYATLTRLLSDLRAMGETNALADRSRKFAPRQLFDRVGDIYATHFSKEGRLNASFEIITLTGWAPSPDQPQPLRPGSAVQRLADALGTEETPLPDNATPKRS